jgi:hypothetical protein
MICPTCHGARFVREDYLVLPYQEHGVVAAVVPCPTCRMFGVIHRCERERPDGVPPKGSNHDA